MVVLIFEFFEMIDPLKNLGLQRYAKYCAVHFKRDKFSALWKQLAGGR
jgi:hypothetical protein